MRIKLQTVISLISLWTLVSIMGASCSPSDIKPVDPEPAPKPALPSDKGNVMVEALDYNSYEPEKASWKWYESIIVDSMGVVPSIADKTNRYGSLDEDLGLAATGFFRTAKYNERWILVDPEGKLHIDAGVVTIAIGGGETNKAAFSRKFGEDTDSWFSSTMDSLYAYGFNGAGAWSDEESILYYNDFSTDGRKCSYCPLVNPMSDYGFKIGVATHKPGNTGYPNNCIPVFDPAFQPFCKAEIDEFVLKYKDDPNVLGYFTDNEIPFRLSNLEGYLTLEEGNYGRLAAEAWLTKKGLSKADITDEIKLEFVGYVAETYYRIVGTCLKDADPNHLYLGSRLAGSSKTFRTVYQAAAKYCDIVSVNYYGNWSVQESHIANWEQWADKPFMITEFYTKAEDSGLGNTSGDGWIVRDQKSRGIHYENFIIGLLRSDNCVGWSWCKYLDNDPTSTHAEASNIDSNKGIFNNEYEPYRALVESMKKVNSSRYSILSQHWTYEK